MPSPSSTQTKEPPTPLGPVDRSQPCVISVVIAWVNPLELLKYGLDSLRQETNRPPDEVIVVTRHSEIDQARLRRLYPEVILLSAPRHTPITALRSLGLKHARGNVVVVTEDHCVPSADWLGAVERRMGEGYDIVGGPIENACTSRLRDWAAFLTEYAFAVLPDASAQEAKTNPASRIACNNVAYRRAFISGLCRTLESGQWESFYRSQLDEREVKMTYEPKMMLYHRRPFDFWYFVTQRYHFCRSFAAMRCQMISATQKLKYGVGSALLPPLLLLRGLRTIAGKRRLIGRYLTCLPLIATYFTAGAVGEMTGYFLGGGTSLERVE
jgi:glycosyltransferase involved in cell wall biosynthesis